MRDDPSCPWCDTQVIQKVQAFLKNNKRLPTYIHDVLQKNKRNIQFLGDVDDANIVLESPGIYIHGSVAYTPLNEAKGIDVLVVLPSGDESGEDGWF